MSKAKLNQVGDTIVEVLLAVVVVGIAIGLGYGVASRSLKANRQAQERVEAVKLAENQVERMKKLSTKPAAAGTPAGGGVFEQAVPFCIADTNDAANTIVPEEGIPLNLSEDSLSDYEGPCIKDELYHTAIISNGPNQYNIVVRWNGLGSLDKEEVVIGYRVYPPVN